jgi:hypothetical protein
MPSTSKRQARASRANGRLSRGPVTPAGLLRAKTAAITHGLTASTAVLATESHERFHRLHDTYRLLHHPANDAEELLVEQLAIVQWHLRRVWGIETALLDHEMGALAPAHAATYQRLDGATRTGLAWHSFYASGTHAGLHRHQTRLSRLYERTLAQLEYLQNLRAAAGQLEEQVAPPPDKAQRPTPESGNKNLNFHDGPIPKNGHLDKES